MKIAYILHHNILHLDGVSKKVYRQIKFWSQNIEVKIFALVPGIIRDVEPEPNTEVFQYASLSQRIEATCYLVDSVFQWSPDMIYFRYNPPYPPLARLFRLFPTIVELNSDDVKQYRWDSLKKYLYNLATRHLVLGRASGIIYNNFELASRSYNLKYSLPKLILGEGIDLSEYPILPGPSNVYSHLAFIGKSGLIWHGLDKILWLAEQQPEVHFDLIGISKTDISRELPGNVQAHGFLPKDDYSRILAQADIALGTLALHRIGVNETASLKLREYLAYGLPSVIAHQDPDFSEEDDFIFRLPNIEDNVRLHMVEIQDFIERFKGRRVSRNLVSYRIDSTIKEQERLEFILNCVD